MKYIRLYEENKNESSTNLRVGDIVVCIEKDGTNSFALENGKSYRIERILKLLDNRKLDDVEKVDNKDDTEFYYFTLYNMNGELLQSSDKTGSLIFKVERFLSEYEYSANKYNL